jgi:hypothetical protein
MPPGGRKDDRSRVAEFHSVLGLGSGQIAVAAMCFAIFVMDCSQEEEERVEEEASQLSVAWRAQASAQDWVGPLVLEICPAVA